MAKYRDPIKRIPPEIWENILFKVQCFGNNENNSVFASSTDLYNSYRAWVTFKNILENTKPSWLFPQVVSYLAPYFDEKEILQCRLICKYWKCAVDHYIENKLENDSNNFCNHQFKKLTCRFSEKGEIPRFLQTFQNHTGCPFPGSTLYLEHIHLSTVDSIEFWGTEVFSLLIKFGNYVRNFSIKFSFEIQHLSIQIILSLIPNLRRLTLESMNIDRNSRFWTEPFPELKLLTCLKLDFKTTEISMRDHLTFVHCQILSKYQQQLMELQITLFNELWISKPQFFLPNLEFLEVSLLYPKQLYTFLPSENQNGPNKLRFLKVIFSESPTNSDKKPEEISLRHVFRPLRPYSNSLNKVIIIASGKVMTKPVSEEDLKYLKGFNSLKYLRLEGFYFYRIQLLLELPKSLECLHVWGMLDMYDENGLFGDNVLAEKLPKLRELSVQDGIFANKRIFQKESENFWGQKRGGLVLEYGGNKFLCKTKANKIWLGLIGVPLGFVLCIYILFPAAYWIMTSLF